MCRARDRVGAPVRSHHIASHRMSGEKFHAPFQGSLEGRPARTRRRPFRSLLQPVLGVFRLRPVQLTHNVSTHS